MADHDVTQLLQEWRGGKPQALEELTPLVYGELRKLAGSYLRRERINHTLQSTALVHEAFLKLVDQREVNWQSRAHFYAIAAQMIRRILVDHARAHKAAKRGAGANLLSLDEAIGVPERRNVELLRLDDALNALAELDAQQAKLVELRFFAGLSIEETAEVLGVSPATVKRSWAVAKVWLMREVSRGAGDGAE